MAAATSRKRITPSSLAPVLEAAVVVQHRRHDAGGPVGRGGDHAPAGGVLLVHRERVGVHPVHDVQRLHRAALGEHAVQARRAAAHLEHPGQQPGLAEAALDAAPASPATGAAASRAPPPRCAQVRSLASISSYISSPCSRHSRSRSSPEVNGYGGARVRARLARLGLIAAHHEAAADRVVVLLAQHAGRRRRARVKRMPLEWRGRRSCIMNSSCIGSSKAISCSPRSRMRPLARMRCTVGSMLSGSTVSGCAPSRPTSTARSVPWPMPGQRERAVQAHRDLRGLRRAARRASSPSTNSRAARIGPMVWELDGPMPTLKMSNTLSVMEPNLARRRAPPCGAHCRSLRPDRRPTCFAATCGDSNATPQPPQARAAACLSGTAVRARRAARSASFMRAAELARGARALAGVSS